jgi:hypothetical protein
MNKAVSGLELEKKLGVSTFFNFLGEDLTRGDFKYSIGKNMNFPSFDSSSGKYKRGGLYFTTLDHIFEFIKYGETQIGVITLFDDSNVYYEDGENEYKTNKFILNEIVSVKDFLQRFISPLEAVKQNGFVLQYIEEQTDEICLEAVKQNGMALQFVFKQTPEICLEAVKQNGFALQYIEEQTDEIWSEAIKQKEDEQQFVK